MKDGKLNEDQRKMVEENLKLVPFTVSRFIGKSKLEMEDIMSLGYIGLCRAAISYTPGRGNFSTYAVRSIRNSILREFQNDKCKCRHTDMEVISLNQTVPGIENSSELFEVIMDRRVDVETEVIDRIICRDILERIPVAKRIYYDGESPKDVAKEKKMTKQHVYITCKRELERAKKFLEEGE